MQNRKSDMPRYRGLYSAHICTDTHNISYATYLPLHTYISYATYLPYTHNMHYLDEVPEHKRLITVSNDVKKGGRIIERQAQQRYDRIDGRHINDAHCKKKKLKLKKKKQQGALSSFSAKRRFKSSKEETQKIKKRAA